MSRLENLIAELCPDGVGYKRLDEVCEFIKGKGLSKNLKGLGDVPIILYGELYTTYGNYITDIVSSTSKKNVLSSPIIRRGDLVLPISSTTKEAQIGKASAYMAIEPVYLGGDAIILRHNQIAGYMVYLLNGLWFEKLKMKCVFGTTINHLHPNKLAKIEIPVPPLPIQEEIVRILDTFTALEAELEAELEARTRQYEYYRDALLDFDPENPHPLRPTRVNDLIQTLCPDGIPLIDLGETCEILDSQRKPVTKSDRQSGIYPYYGANGIQDYVDDYIFDGTFLLMGEDGSVINPDKSPILTWAIGKIWVNNHAHILSKKEGYSLRYLYYYLQTVDVSSIVRGVPPKINQKYMSAIKVAVPPLPVQNEIVAILDRFDALVNDLKNGLPAEIAARRKQYEYYRDQLLTFKPLE